eukprot:365808-Chlamydomonas_euryale.AAC.23
MVRRIATAVTAVAASSAVDMSIALRGALEHNRLPSNVQRPTEQRANDAAAANAVAEMRCCRGRRHAAIARAARPRRGAASRGKRALLVPLWALPDEERRSVRCVLCVRRQHHAAAPRTRPARDRLGGSLRGSGARAVGTACGAVRGALAVAARALALAELTSLPTNTQAHVEPLGSWQQQRQRRDSWRLRESVSRARRAATSAVRPLYTVARALSRDGPLAAPAIMRAARAASEGGNSNFARRRWKGPLSGTQRRHCCLAGAALGGGRSRCAAAAGTHRALAPLRPRSGPLALHSANDRTAPPHRSAHPLGTNSRVAARSVAGQAERACSAVPEGF